MASKKQELVVEVTTKADQAKRDLAELDKAAKKFEGQPIEVPVKVDADQAKAQLETTARAAGGAKNAFANLVGNTAQDLGNLGGPLGSVGVALGQVAEYTADAANQGGGLKSALSGVVGMVGPLAGLSLATLAVTDAVSRWKERQAELKKIHEESMESFVEATGVIEKWGTTLDEAFDQGTLNRVESLGKILADRYTPDELNRVAKAFGQLGLEMKDLGTVLPEADADFEAFARKMLLAAGASPQLADAMANLINKTGSIGDISRQAEDGISTMFDALGPEQAEKLKQAASGLEELDAQAQNLDLQKIAEDSLNVARAFDATGVSAAELGGGLPLEQYQRYTAAQQEATRATAEAKTKNEALGQQMYDTAIAMGKPVAEAQRLKDELLAIPPVTAADVLIAQRGDDPAGYLDGIPDRITTDVYINGILDRNILNAINNLPPGSIPGSRGVAPAAPVGPSAGLLAVNPMAGPSARATTTTNINVNMGGSIVADTFQLQRVVERAVRSGARLGGRR